MKKCTACGKMKPLDEFYKNSRGGRKAQCILCARAKARAYQAAKPKASRLQKLNPAAPAIASAIAMLAQEQIFESLALDMPHFISRGCPCKRLRLCRRRELAGVWAPCRLPSAWDIHRMGAILGEAIL